MNNPTQDPDDMDLVDLSDPDNIPDLNDHLAALNTTPLDDSEMEELDFLDSDPDVDELDLPDITTGRGPRAATTTTTVDKEDETLPGIEDDQPDELSVDELPEVLAAHPSAIVGDGFVDDYVPDAASGAVTEALVDDPNSLLSNGNHLLTAALDDEPDTVQETDFEYPNPDYVAAKMAIDDDPSLGFDFAESIPLPADIAVKDKSKTGSTAIPLDKVTDDPFTPVAHPGDNVLLDADAFMENFQNAPEPDEMDDYQERVNALYGDEEDDFDSASNPLSGYDLDGILADAIDMDASDVHIYPDRRVSFTILGDIVHSPEGRYPVLTTYQTSKMLEEVTTFSSGSAFNASLDLDVAYSIRTGRHQDRRFRVKVGQSMGGLYYVFRTISSSVPDPRSERIHAPEEVIDWFSDPRGLVLVNGPTGVGKSTTLASLVNYFSKDHPFKICTVEDPVEFVYSTDQDSVAGMISQREVGPDVKGFAPGIKAALRENPDMILVGEVRDRDEVRQLLRASRSGHLAVSTMHTNSCATTLNQIKQLFDGDEQAGMLAQLAETTKGFVNQLLVKSPDGESRWAVREVLEFTEEVVELVENGDVSGLRQYQYDRQATMEHQLYFAAKQGHCTLEEARSKAEHRRTFDRIVRELEPAS